MLIIYWAYLKMVSFRVRLEMEEVKQKSKDEEDVSILHLLCNNICLHLSTLYKNSQDTMFILILPKCCSFFK